MGKLVRDNLEKPIRLTHPQSSFKYIKDNELGDALKDKLKEEMSEFLEANTLESKTEEAGDILEVLECLLELNSVKMETVQSKKTEKTAQKGSFKNGVYWVDS